MLLRSISLAVCCANGPDAASVPDFAGTASQRKVLFEELVEKTLAREVFAAPGPTREEFEEQALAMRKEFLQAKNETLLYAALWKFSNLRRRPWLAVAAPEDGLRPNLIYSRSIPVRIAAEIGDEAPHRFFLTATDPRIADMATEVAPKRIPIEVGDEVLEVEGDTLEEFVEKIAPHVPWSTESGLWWRAAQLLSRRAPRVGPGMLDANDVEFLMRKPNGGRKYKLRLNWEYTSDVQLPVARRHSGFTAVWEGSCGRALVPKEQVGGVVLLDWRQFDREDLEDELGELMESMDEQGLLGHDVILDLTSCSGAGADSWLLLQRLASKEFQVTTSDLRVSDALPAVVQRELPNAETRLGRWLEETVLAAVESDVEQLGPVPHRLSAAPADSDGILQPADLAFRGRLAVLLGPEVRGEAEQLAAMIVDNELGTAVGMPTAGDAMGWFHTEGLSLPRSDRTLVEFSWCVGQVYRPDGTRLDTNPVVPHHAVPFTATNCATWDQDLVLRALEEFAQGGR